MQYYTDDSLIYRLAKRENDGGSYKMGCENKKVDVRVIFSGSDSLWIKLLELRRRD